MLYQLGVFYYIVPSLHVTYRYIRKLPLSTSVLLLGWCSQILYRVAKLPRTCLFSNRPDTYLTAFDARVRNKLEGPETHASSKVEYLWCSSTYQFARPALNFTRTFWDELVGTLPYE